eukprot:Em0002g888a
MVEAVQVTVGKVEAVQMEMLKVEAVGMNMMLKVEAVGMNMMLKVEAVGMNMMLKLIQTTGYDLGIFKHQASLCVQCARFGLLKQDPLSVPVAYISVFKLPTYHCQEPQRLESLFGCDGSDLYAV